MNTDTGKGQGTPTPTLNSWKEIAVYLGRGVRTVQRWQMELRLPIHKIRNTRHSPVFAYINELDEWLRRQAGARNEGMLNHYQIGEKLKQQIRVNLERMQKLQQELRETRRTHKQLINELRQQRAITTRFLRRRDAPQ